MGTGDRILIIKLAALGDVVQALGPFAAIRAHHRDARVVLLTTAPYQDLARATGLFDDIWLDERPRGVDLAGWMRLRAALRAGQFDRVYDLQTSDRSSFYLRLFWPGPRPRWSGIAKGCSHPHANPLRDTLHTLDRQAEQLAMAGIETVPQPGTALTGNDFQAASPEFLSNLGLRPPFALLIPGGAAHRPEKRWPVENFAKIADHLHSNGTQPVLLGTTLEKEIIARITEACPQTQDLSGRTDLVSIVRLARSAVSAIGNDTGPMHLIAAAGCPSVVLFSAASDPALCGPRGAGVTILRQPRLADLNPERVIGAMVS